MPPIAILCKLHSMAIGGIRRSKQWWRKFASHRLCPGESDFQLACCFQTWSTGCDRVGHTNCQCRCHNISWLVAPCMATTPQFHPVIPRGSSRWTPLYHRYAGATSDALILAPPPGRPTPSVGCTSATEMVMPPGGPSERTSLTGNKES